MNNRAMARKLAEGKAWDISGYGPDEEGHYRLPMFMDRIDYADAKTERWIWSIAKHDETGEIIASLQTRAGR